MEDGGWRIEDGGWGGGKVGVCGRLGEATLPSLSSILFHLSSILYYLSSIKSLEREAFEVLALLAQEE